MGHVGIVVYHGLTVGLGGGLGGGLDGGIGRGRGHGGQPGPGSLGLVGQWGCTPIGLCTPFACIFTPLTILVAFNGATYGLNLGFGLVPGRTLGPCGCGRGGL